MLLAEQQAVSELSLNRYRLTESAEIPRATTRGTDTQCLNRYRLTESAEISDIFEDQCIFDVSTAIDSLRVLKFFTLFILSYHNLGLNRYRLTESAEIRGLASSL